ncbi:Hypothetical predicted protein [Paramuricea clavata]|uniref:Uncharacterized protein n=1 Tax=Paramuricea clavata TaxID=317549 RepID=A0A7D9DZS2_PARCT|nr:Hypothetical predicted protein [Paramuricea clavata]
MLWLIGTTADDETKEPAREHCEAGTTKGAEKQTVEDDEASTTEVTAADEFGETSTKETSTLLSEERPTVDGIETAGNREKSNEFGARKLKPARLLFVNLGNVKEDTLRTGIELKMKNLQEECQIEINDKPGQALENVAAVRVM